MEGAVKDEWEVEPLRIREGGVSIPPVLYDRDAHIFVVYSLGAVSREGVCMSCLTFTAWPEHGEELMMGLRRLRGLIVYNRCQDQAHLPNERISLSNLQKGKRVVERFLTTVAGFSRTEVS